MVIEKKQTRIKALFLIGLILGIIALIFTYIGLPNTYDTEPILGFRLLFISIAGLQSCKT